MRIDIGLEIQRNRARQDQILVTLSAAALDRVRLMKTLFLVWHRSGRPAESPFTWQPYLYGPCAFDLYGSLEELERDCFVAISPHPLMNRATYRLTKAGVQQVPGAEVRLGDDLATAVRTTARWTAGMGFRELLDRVYADAPDFATRSVLHQPAR